MLRRWLAVTLGATLCLAACDLWTDPGELTAKAGPQPGPSCSACHAYVLADSNHLFHLFRTSPNFSKFNGPITCLDCHATSIQSHDTAFLDSTFFDPDSNQWHTLDFPVIADSLTMADTIRRDYKLGPVDSFTVHRGFVAPARPGPPPDSGLTEWMTGLAHMNGVVDVVFDPRMSDTVKYLGAHATYNPAEQTCSAVACHPPGDPWRFAAPGLPGIKH